MICPKGKKECEHAAAEAVGLVCSHPRLQGYLRLNGYKDTTDYNSSNVLPLSEIDRFLLTHDVRKESRKFPPRT